MKVRGYEEWVGKEQMPSVFMEASTSNGGGVIVDCFDMVFDRVEMDEGDVVFACEFEFGMAAVAGVALEAEREADIANSAAGRRPAFPCISRMEEMV